MLFLYTSLDGVLIIRYRETGVPSEHPATLYQGYEFYTMTALVSIEKSTF